MITEKIQLLGKGLYNGDIPDELTLTSIPTASELDYVGSEEFEATMLDKILPQAVVEKDINFRNLLEIDFQWILRCLRLLNYGPYHTTNAIYCGECGQTSYGEFRVNLNTIPCKAIPENFENKLVIKRDEFLDFNGDVILKLPTIQDVMNAYKDKAFINEKGRINRELARMCYMITSIKGKTNLTPIDIKMIIQKEFSSADYILLKNEIAGLTDFGLRAGGSTQCPKCHSMNASFIALVDDRFLRPSVGDLREWKHSRSARAAEKLPGDKATTV